MKYAYAFLFLAVNAAVAAEKITVDSVVEHKNQYTHEQKNIRQELEMAQHDLLEKKELSSQNNISEAYSDAEIAQNPELMEKLFVQALLTGNKKALPHLIDFYQKVAQRDPSLIEWGNAILLAEENPEEAIKIYRQLISHFPDNTYIRFQLAHTLFAHQEYEAARSQFEKLRSAQNISEADRQVFEQFMSAIDQKDRWNFSMSATYLNDGNLGNTAKKGTKFQVGNGTVESGERQKGQGLSTRFSVDKQWSLGGGKYISLENSNNLRYYWNNKKFNELNFYLGAGFGYRSPKYQFEISPNFSKKLYGGGSSGDGKLNSHSNTYGLSLSASTWLSPSLKYSIYYNYGYEQYTRQSYARNNDGGSHSLNNAFTYYSNPKQYWNMAVDLSRKNAKVRNNAYNRVGLRLAWGQEWPLGISSYSSIGLAQRNYLEKDWHGVVQKNKEFSANVMLWHKAIHYAGLTPRLSLNYHKTKSNVSIFSYDKFQAFIEVSKSF